MKRLHVHVGVTDLDRSIAFYSILFGAGPTVAKGDYAKWMLDDPSVNFAISSGRQSAPGIEHLGLQVESAEELDEVYGRLRAAGGPILEEGETVCCYAKSEKSWIADPDGVAWEAFLTHGQTTTYGVSAPLENLTATECCDATTPQDVCCAPKPERPAAAPCCG